MDSSPLQLAFSRRANADGTTSSICPRCYVTVGAATRAADLDHAERAHHCDPTRLQLFQMTHKPPFRATWIPPQKSKRTA
jgi:hypothetical protein